MNDTKMTIAQLKSMADKFVQDRDWGQFHDAKNLSMNLAVEAAELMEHFIWFDGQESAQKMIEGREPIEQEIADVAISVLLLCVRYDVDLATIIEKKIKLICEKYPVEKSRGKRAKYNKL